MCANRSQRDNFVATGREIVWRPDRRRSICQQKKSVKFLALLGRQRGALLASAPLTEVSYLYKLGGMGGL